VLDVIPGLCFEDASRRTWWKCVDCRLYVIEELIYEIVMEEVVGRMRLKAAVFGAGGRHLPGNDCPRAT